MSGDEHHRPIIIVRRKKVVHGHHGGAWKIAFADFMTALMALFLVLWLLSSSTPEQKQAVADYFSTPLIAAIGKGDRNASSASVIPGGGPDPTFSEGERNRIDPREQQLLAEERERMEELKERIENVINSNAQLKEIRDQIRIDVTPEGLRIQLVDTEQRPMFELGSVRVAPYMKALLRTIAPMLNQLPNRIQISGHTDGVPYVGGESGYSNWELSADRAGASRRELVAGGLASEKLLRVSGMADRVPFPGAAPNAATNRRIMVVVLNTTTTQAVLSPGDSASTPPPTTAPATPSAPAGAPALPPSTPVAPVTAPAAGLAPKSPPAPAPAGVHKPAPAPAAPTFPAAIPAPAATPAPTTAPSAAPPSTIGPLSVPAVPAPNTVAPSSTMVPAVPAVTTPASGVITPAQTSTPAVTAPVKRP